MHKTSSPLIAMLLASLASAPAFGASSEELLQLKNTVDNLVQELVKAGVG
ncbi:MAG: hypothetical protein U1F34_07155 [Gammaproteobacteria bacterium]